MALHELPAPEDPYAHEDVNEKLLSAHETAEQRAKPYNILEQAPETRTLLLDSTVGHSVHVALIAAWAYYLSRRLTLCFIGGSWVEWSALFCELILAASDFLPMLELTLLLSPTSIPSRRPLYRLVGPTAPMVHTLIPTCGEDIQTVMDTIVGAAVQDYPPNCCQVFVLDDAGSPELCQAVQAFNSCHNSRQATAAPVVYLAREKKPGIPHHYKAGNIRYGITTTHEEFGSSEYIAALDADMIPERDWLSRTVPHLIRSPELAMVNPPQLSYNCPDKDPLAQDTNVFAQVQEPLRDRFGASQCSGSGYIMRRSALDSIGGWPLVNIGEDIVCSYALAKQGWTSAFIQDELQFGMVPGSFHTYIAQRLRWTAGSLLIAKKFRFFLPGLDHGSSRSGYQRFFGMLHAVKTYVNAAIALPMIVLPILMLCGSFGTATLSVNTARGSLRIPYLILWLLSKIWKLLAFGHLGAGNMSNASKNRYWVVPYHIYSVVTSFFTDLEETKFTVSGTFKSPINERSETDRSSLLYRLMDPLILMHTIYYFSGIIILVLCTRRTMYTALILRLLDMVLANGVPFWYMVSPPTVPERREMLERDEDGVFRAKRKGWKWRGGSVVSWKDGLEMIIILGLDWL